jgi:hypothetical protein
VAFAIRFASPARNCGFKSVAARLAFPNVPDAVFVDVFRTVGDNQLSAALGAFDHCSIALHGQSARYELFVQKRSIANRSTSRIKMRLPGLLRFKSNERFAAREKRETLSARRSEKIVLRFDQILFRVLSR